MSKDLKTFCSLLVQTSHSRYWYKPPDYMLTFVFLINIIFNLPAHVNSNCSSNSSFNNNSLLFHFGFCKQSYANAAISSLEDPEKVLDQAVLEMNDDLVKMRQSTAQVCVCVCGDKSQHNIYIYDTHVYIFLSLLVCSFGSEFQFFNKSDVYFLILQVIASQRLLGNKYKAAEQASADW